MSERLALWLYGLKVATVELERSRMRLRYTPEALDSFPAGTPLLSLKLPLSEQRFPNSTTRSMLDGLLPEGDGRLVLAAQLRLRTDDTFGLARALGRDCAGAIVILPDEDAPPPASTTLSAEPLSEDQLARLVTNLRSAPLGIDQRVRISLAGVQEKLLLTQMPDGSWGRPVDGTPSTHILKPEIRGYSRTVENEAFCMRLAKHLGLDVSTIETIDVASRKLIAVSRYDRIVAPDGEVVRVHQEDLCQATGTPPEKKYQEDGGPSLRGIADILTSVNRPSLPRLLEAMTFNVVIGNGDAHAKNFSLLHDRAGSVRLAPLYDLLSTLMYGDDRLAMYVNNVRRTNRVSFDRLLNEAATWDLSRARATEIVSALLARIPNAVEQAARETPGVPEEILDLIAIQLDRLQPT